MQAIYGKLSAPRRKHSSTVPMLFHQRVSCGTRRLVWW
jgi:hypothetical protein